MLFDVKSKIRTIIVNEELFFIATDVCKKIGISTKDLSRMLNKKMIAKPFNTAGGQQNLLLLDSISAIQIIQNSRKLSTKQKNELLNELNLNTVAIGCQEAEFLQSIKDVLMQANIDIEIQKQVLSYRIDLYLPEYNLAIEFDESHHKKQVEQDIKRQKEIETYLGCSFIRVPESNTTLQNIGLILRHIKK